MSNSENTADRMFFDTVKLSQPVNEEIYFMLEKNKVIVLRSFEEIWNKRNLSVIEEIYAVDYIGHIAASAEAIRGPGGLKRFAAMFQLVFPDIYFTIEDQIAEKNKVATRWRVSATQQGELMGIPPRGEVIALMGVSIQHISDGKIIESWDNWDALSMLQSLTGDVFELLSVGI